MPLNRTLFPLNDNAPEVIAFLEDNFVLEDGKTVAFEPWQRAHVLTPVIERSKHQWDTFLIGLGKKNGKSTLAACVAVYALLLDDPHPEVYSTAGDKDQAKIIFDFTAKAIKRSRLRGYFRFYADSIERADGAGAYRVLASDASGPTVATRVALSGTKFGIKVAMTSGRPSRLRRRAGIPSIS